MPQAIEHIDAIARRLKRDVLYLDFVKAKQLHYAGYSQLDSRVLITQWLDSEQISWCPCGPFASETVMRPYAGEIYVDVPFDEVDAKYSKVQTFLEHADGTMRFDGVKFYIVTLEHAMKNAHYDEPGFWERWADNF